MASAPAISGRNIRTLLSLCLVAFAFVGSPLLCNGFGVILASGYSLAFAAAIRSIDRKPRECGGDPKLPGVGGPRTKRWVVVIIVILVVGGACGPRVAGSSCVRAAQISRSTGDSRSVSLKSSGGETCVAHPSVS